MSVRDFGRLGDGWQLVGLRLRERARLELGEYVGVDVGKRIGRRLGRQLGG
jgi:hypothetical protein